MRGQPRVSEVTLERYRSYMHMMLNLKIQEIQSCEQIQVSGGSDKLDPTVHAQAI